MFTHIGKGSRYKLGTISLHVFGRHVGRYPTHAGTVMVGKLRSFQVVAFYKSRGHVKIGSLMAFYGVVTSAQKRAIYFASRILSERTFTNKCRKEEHGSVLITLAKTIRYMSYERRYV